MDVVKASKTDNKQATLNGVPTACGKKKFLLSFLNLQCLSNIKL